MSVIFQILLLIVSAINLEARPKVLATASMWADMAKNIGGDLIEVDMIVPVGSDPHLYEATPNDIRKVNSADLILINGFTFEGWLQKLIGSSGTKAKSVLLTEGITPISNPEFKNSTDPHAWMDVEYGKTYALNITKALCNLLPQYKKQLEANFEEYNQQLTSLDHYIRSEILKIPQDQRILITSHDAFHYYGQRYGIQVEALLGTSTDADVQTGDFLRINKIIREKRVPALFIESTINPKLMEQIVKENKIRIGGKLYADSLGDESSPASSYISMLKHNTDVIVEALSSPTDEPLKSNEQESSNPLIIVSGLIILCLMMVAAFYIVKRSKQKQ